MELCEYFLLRLGRALLATMSREKLWWVWLAAGSMLLLACGDGDRDHSTHVPDAGTAGDLEEAADVAVADGGIHTRLVMNFGEDIILHNRRNRRCRGREDSHAGSERQRGAAAP